MHKFNWLEDNQITTNNILPPNLNKFSKQLENFPKLPYF